MVKDWHHLVDTFNGVALLTVAAAPVAVLVVCVLAFRRRTGAQPWRTSVAEVGMIYGTVPDGPATFRRHIENRIQAGNTTSP
ncbi:hypothetical protein EV651_101242 [Kribbella sp. VKM Ac-2571]|nr:hypothetical protein EV651_101242 [Kribbella sp. VKM Ac-2571]